MQNQPQPVTQSMENTEAAYMNLEFQQRQSQSASNALIKDGLAAQARGAFIFKVYVLLTFQLLITFGFCALSQYYQPYRQFQIDYGWFMVFPVIFLMACMFIAMCVPKAREFPLDMVLLLFFILSFSYIISFTCSIVTEQTPGPTVIIAIGITVGITIAITIYSFFCKANFMVLIGVLIVVCVTMFLIFIVVIFTWAPILISIYCGLAAIIYGIYLIFITKMIMGGQIGDFPMDNYILASLFLYIYIIKMFLMILRIVANSRK